MSTLSTRLADAVGPGAQITPEDLVAVHVSSAQLSPAGGADTPEAVLHRAILQYPNHPRRVRVRGDGGSGKTSLIMRAISERDAGGTRPQVLVIRCGEDPSRLSSPASFVRLMVDTVRVQGTFASVDPDALARAAATEITTTPGSATQTGGLGGGPLPIQYQFSWTDAVESLTSELSPEERRSILTDSLGAAADHAPLTVVVDDTDRFAGVGPTGDVDREAIRNLFEHGIKTLIEMPVGIVVAVHPLYDSVAGVAEALERGEFASVEVPALPVNRGIEPLLSIIRKRLQVRVQEIDPEPLVHFDRDAVAQLQALYFDGDHDLRRVLRRCKACVNLAIADDAPRVSIEHVQRELEVNSG